MAQAAPERIISLTPHITELLYDVGAGKQLIAVDSASDYPPQVKSLPKVANYQSINVEKILALNPDLIVAWKPAQQRLLEPLKAFHIPIIYSDPTTLDSLGSELKKLGKQTGHPRQGELAANRYQQQLSALRASYQHRTAVQALYLMEGVPLTTVAADSWISQELKLCGADNIFKDAITPYPQISEEQVLQRNPKMIIVGSHSSKSLALWKQWPEIAAVKAGQLYRVDPDLLSRLTPRSLKGIEALCLDIQKARRHYQIH
ncbi:cobalamin-binding protein [Dongshaea marina]|uniref:cobalamin-binding protein n=1 Tax=Dongshaea marina TaxID=2047966 RepID=UPI001F1EFFCC|nr:cobalamin-binding protein [Dongshaea marina]